MGSLLTLTYKEHSSTITSGSCSVASSCTQKPKFIYSTMAISSPNPLFRARAASITTQTLPCASTSDCVCFVLFMLNLLQFITFFIFTSFLKNAFFVFNSLYAILFSRAGFPAPLLISATTRGGHLLSASILMSIKSLRAAAVFQLLAASLTLFSISFSISMQCLV